MWNARASGNSFAKIGFDQERTTREHGATP